MNWQDLFSALALVLVIEGLLPFANPAGWRRALKSIIELDDNVVRGIGMASIVAGLILLYLVRSP